MSKILFILMAFALILSCTSTNHDGAGAPPGIPHDGHEFVPGELIVEFNAPVSEQTAVDTIRGIVGTSTITGRSLDRHASTDTSSATWLFQGIPVGKEIFWADRIGTEAGITFAEPNYYMSSAVAN